jgi:hypothetical protein
MFTTPNRKSIYTEIGRKGDLTASKYFPELSHGNNRRPTRWIRRAQSIIKSCDRAARL